MLLQDSWEGDDFDLSREVGDLQEGHFFSIFGEDRLRGFDEAGDHGLHAPQALLRIFNARLLILQFVFVLIQRMAGYVVP